MGDSCLSFSALNDSLQAGRNQLRSFRKADGSKKHSAAWCNITGTRPNSFGCSQHLTTSSSGKMGNFVQTQEDAMVGWHHQLRGHESEQTPGDHEGQGSLCVLQFTGSQRAGHDLATEQEVS